MVVFGAPSFVGRGAIMPSWVIGEVVAYMAPRPGRRPPSPSRPVRHRRGDRRPGPGVSRQAGSTRPDLGNAPQLRPILGRREHVPAAGGRGECPGRQPGAFSRPQTSCELLLVSTELLLVSNELRWERAITCELLDDFARKGGDPFFACAGFC